jgi:hypothetical protein
MTVCDKSRSFIGQEMNTWIEANKKGHQALFEEADRLNSDCYRILNDTKIDSNSLRQTVISCLFPRCMELFQAIYILAARGMSPSANIMLRSLMETTFVLCAVAKDDEALHAYVLNDELERRRVANKALSKKGDSFADVPLSAIREIKAELEKEIKAQKIEKYTTERFAEKAGLRDWYLTAYTITSQAVHATIRDMEQYLVIDENAGIKAIKFVPLDKEPITALSVACVSMVFSLQHFLLVFGRNTAVCDEHAKIMEGLMKLT